MTKLCRGQGNRKDIVTSLSHSLDSRVFVVLVAEWIKWIYGTVYQYSNQQVR